MRASPLIGAVLLVGLGLDCASAPTFVDRAIDQELVSTPPPAYATTSAEVEAEVAPEPAPAPAAMEPGTRYVSLSAGECAAELSARGIAHESLAPRLGIVSPVRLRGPLSGVTFRTLWPEPERSRSSYEICDCRLVLALDDFAKVLHATYGIVDVMYFSAYRPPPAGWSEPVGLRHEGGLAIDIGYFRKSDGTALNVEWDFIPRPHERICAPGRPPNDATPSAIELRKLACDAASSHLFHLALTPAYDRVHRDHFHLELTPGKTDFVAR